MRECRGRGLDGGEKEACDFGRFVKMSLVTLPFASEEGQADDVMADIATHCSRKGNVSEVCERDFYLREREKGKEGKEK